MAKGWQQSESSITRGLLGKLRKRWAGSFWIKVHGSPFQPRLIDVIGVVAGRFVGLEVKRPGEDATPRQKLTIAQLRSAGALVSVVHSYEEAEKFLLAHLDRSSDKAYDGTINMAQEPKGKRKMATKAKAKTSTRKAKEEPEDELDDLDDLDDFDEDDLDDEDEEDEDDEEDEPVTTRRASRTKTTTKAKTTKAAPAKTKGKAAPAKSSKAKSNGASNLPARRIAEGMVGVADIADEVGSEPRVVRVHLRKLEVEKADSGLYEWKPGSRDFKSVVSKVKKSIAG